MTLKALLKMCFRSMSMSNDDPRLVALAKYATSAGCTELSVYALRTDAWSWLDAKLDGADIHIDIRNVPCATAMIAAALQCLRDERKARQACAAEPGEAQGYHAQGL